MSAHPQLLGPQIDTIDMNWMSGLFRNAYQINGSTLIEEMLSLLYCYHNQPIPVTSHTHQRDPLRHLL